MHPLLASPRRLAIYLVLWIPVLSLLVWLVWTEGGVTWIHAAEVLAPSCLVFAFACLSAWQICRYIPLQLSRVAALAGTWLAAASAASLVLVGAAGLFSYLFERPAPHLDLLFAVGFLVYLFSAGLHYTALAAERSREAERRAAEARTLARESELRALTFQLNPHFLFNSLHSVAALATSDGPRAREMCIQLAGFLRSTLGLRDRESIPLGEEFSLARAYLDVERVRFGSRLQVEENIGPGCENCPLPALLLQPLVENAVQHGIAGMLEGGAIRIAAQRIGPAVSITLENAFDPEVSSQGHGMGLSHVRRRLEVAYGEDAWFDAGPRDGTYHVELRLPCESPMASSSRA